MMSYHLSPRSVNSSTVIYLFKMSSRRHAMVNFLITKLNTPGSENLKKICLMTMARKLSKIELCMSSCSNWIHLNLIIRGVLPKYTIFLETLADSKMLSRLYSGLSAAFSQRNSSNLVLQAICTSKRNKSPKKSKKLKSLTKFPK